MGFGGRYRVCSGITLQLMDECGSGEGIKDGEVTGSDFAKNFVCQPKEFSIYSLCKGDNPKMWWSGERPWSHVGWK